MEIVLKVGTGFILGGGAGLLLGALLAPRMLKSTLVRRLVEYIGNVDVARPKDTKGTAGVA
jgi:hypothetical protein